MPENIESLINDHSYIIADGIKDIAQNAESEEDVRHGFNKLIDEFIEKANLKIEGKHEYELAGGRIDSVYGRVIIEYKNPKGADKLTVNADSQGVKNVVQQLKNRFNDFQNQGIIEINRIFGVGCDGNFIIFVRHRGTEFEIENPQPVNPHIIERILRALISLGARGRTFTPDVICEKFGADSQIAQNAVKSIYEIISKTQSPKALTFFRQWQILFGEVCGYNVQIENPKIKKLINHYKIQNGKPAELLFSVHTYYSIFIKLLAAELVSFFTPFGISYLSKLVGAPTSEKTKQDMRTLEQGGFWNIIGFKNFIEGDVFSWYLDVWDERLYATIKNIVTVLDEFDPDTLSVEPSESRDLLKNLYQHLFPKSVRHDLGEYYTPDWLAELTLNELDYDGNPDKRILDPACGSGTFLVMIINKVKQWYEKHRFECLFGKNELAMKILKNVIGFDLNPLAVMTARMNYIIAIRDLLKHSGDIEVPVYLCDSILTPSKHKDIYEGKVRKLKTSAGELLIPREVTYKNQIIGKYVDTLERCIREKYNSEDFIKQFENTEVPIENIENHKFLFNQIKKLDENNENGIWARIIKNAFAPLFIEKVDYIAGNPPWINWENLPEFYRQNTANVWNKYKLFNHKGYKAKLGGGKDDISILFVYSTIDTYLKENCRLGFVITQSVFKTKGGGQGFRKFKYIKDGDVIHIKPIVVHDFSSIQIFEDATNRTSIFICQKTSKKFSYPIPYIEWKGKNRINQEEDLPTVKSITTRKNFAAIPVQNGIHTSPWLTTSNETMSGIQKVLGQSDYQGFEGVNTGGLNGCFWINILQKLDNGNLLIENLNNVGKIKLDKIEAVIEPDLVYPLLRGRDVKKWNVTPSAFIILTNVTNKLGGIPESIMKKDYPKTYSFLRIFEGNKDKPTRGTLRGRSGYKRYFKPTDPFYSMYNVGPYTMSEWKVVWPEVGNTIRSSVIGSDKDFSKPILPDHTVVLIPCNNSSESYFICAILNSSIVNVAVKSYIVLHPSPHILEIIKIPRFVKSDKIHKKLAKLSEKCHESAKIGNTKEVKDCEAEIDELAAEIWGITKTELKAIQDELAELDCTGQNCEETEDEDEE